MTLNELRNLLTAVAAIKNPEGFQLGTIPSAVLLGMLRTADGGMRKTEDVRDWLLRRRDDEAKSRDASSAANDMITASDHDACALGYFTAAEGLRKLREINAALTKALQGRIMIAVRPNDGNGTIDPAMIGQTVFSKPESGIDERPDFKPPPLFPEE